MGLLLTVTATVAAVGAGAGAVVYAAATQAQTGAPSIDIWTLIEKGGAPMAAVFALAFFEAVRRHDKAYKIIEAKDATILEMSTRQTRTIETTNEIANDQMKMAQDTHSIIKELVTLLRGRLDIG